MAAIGVVDHKKLIQYQVLKYLLHADSRPFRDSQKMSVYFE